MYRIERDAELHTVYPVAQVTHDFDHPTETSRIEKWKKATSSDMFHGSFLPQTLYQYSSILKKERRYWQSVHVFSKKKRHNTAGSLLRVVRSTLLFPHWRQVTILNILNCPKQSCQAGSIHICRDKVPDVLPHPKTNRCILLKNLPLKTRVSKR